MTVRTGTTKRRSSTEASTPLPRNLTIGTRRRSRDTQFRLSRRMTAVGRSARRIGARELWPAAGHPSYAVPRRPRHPPRHRPAAVRRIRDRVAGSPDHANLEGVCGVGGTARRARPGRAEPPARRADRARYTARPPAPWPTNFDPTASHGVLRQLRENRAGANTLSKTTRRPSHAQLRVGWIAVR